MYKYKYHGATVTSAAQYQPAISNVIFCVKRQTWNQTRRRGFKTNDDTEEFDLERFSKLTIFVDFFRDILSLH